MEQIENVGKMILASDATAMEKAFYGLKIAVMGIGTVFAVLLIIWLVLSVFQIVFDKKPSEKPSVKTTAPAPVAVSAVQNSASDEDDTELIAVLMAAVCAATGSDASKLRIVSYKRQKTPWNRK